MKELTIEEKAKAYDEAIKKAKSLLSNNQLGNAWIYKLLPKLKESEGENVDEKVRKALIKLVTNYPSMNLFIEYDIHLYEALTWLKKQNNKEFVYFDEAEKEKSDFVGDGFIKCLANFLDFKEGETYWLEYISDDKYNVRSDNLLGKTYHITPCQLYTIFKKLTWLEKQGEPTDISSDAVLDSNKDGLIADTIRYKREKQDEHHEYPKDVIDNAISFLANRNDGMPEKEAKDIVNAIITILNPSYWPKQGEQKPAEWSEQDERKCNNIIALVEGKAIMRKDIKGLVNWLNSLKERVQPKQESAEWSEEDGYLLDETIKHLESLIRITKKQGSAYSDEIQYYQRDIDWLKSLRPQKQWKPDSSMLVCLEYAIKHINKDGDKRILSKLLEQLKQL